MLKLKELKILAKYRNFIEMSSVFISGGNRGIGYQLVRQYASIEGNTVITTTRKIERSADLTNLAKDLGNIIVLTLEASSQESIDELEKVLPDAIRNGIDIFIANAAIGYSYYPILTASRDDYEKHYKVNVLGTIQLTKILYPYLLKQSTRKIIYVSSASGRITDMYTHVSTSAYGQSKAALNYTAKALSFELAAEGFIVVPIYPGMVATDMFQTALDTVSAATRESLSGKEITSIACAEAVLKLVGGLTKADSGKFYRYDGEELSY